MKAQAVHPCHVEVEEEEAHPKCRTHRAWGSRGHATTEHEVSSVIGPVVSSGRKRSLARAESMPSKTIM